MAQLSARSVYSVGIFIVASLVAAAIVIGVVVLVNHRGEQVRRDQAKDIAAKELQAQSNNSKDSTSTTQTGTSTSTVTVTSSSTDSSVEPATKLPVTGPADSALHVFIVSILAVSVACFASSRRARQIQ